MGRHTGRPPEKGRSAPPAGPCTAHQASSDSIPGPRSACGSPTATAARGYGGRDGRWMATVVGAPPRCGRRLGTPSGFAAACAPCALEQEREPCLAASPPPRSTAGGEEASTWAGMQPYTHRAAVLVPGGAWRSGRRLASQSAPATATYFVTAPAAKPRRSGQSGYQRPHL